MIAVMAVPAVVAATAASGAYGVAGAAAANAGAAISAARATRAEAVKVRFIMVSISVLLGQWPRPWPARSIAGEITGRLQEM